MVREVQEHMLADQQQQWTNKQTKIMGLRMPAGLHCALPKQTNQQNPQIRIEY